MCSECKGVRQGRARKKSAPGKDPGEVGGTPLWPSNSPTSFSFTNFSFAGLNSLMEEVSETLRTVCVVGLSVGENTSRPEKSFARIAPKRRGVPLFVPNVHPLQIVSETSRLRGQLRR